MSDDLGDIRQRQDRLEGRVGRLEGKVKTQEDLRAAMDEDMGSLKAEFGVQKRLIQAIADTQSDHTARLTRLETGVAELKSDVAELKSGVATIRTGLERVHVGVEAIRDLLDRHLGSDD